MSSSAQHSNELSTEHTSSQRQTSSKKRMASLMSTMKKEWKGMKHEMTGLAHTLEKGSSHVVSHALQSLSAKSPGEDKRKKNIDVCENVSVGDDTVLEGNNHSDESDSEDFSPQCIALLLGLIEEEQNFRLHEIHICHEEYFKLVMIHQSLEFSKKSVIWNQKIEESHKRALHAELQEQNMRRCSRALLMLSRSLVRKSQSKILQLEKALGEKDAELKQKVLELSTEVAQKKNDMELTYELEFKKMQQQVKALQSQLRTSLAESGAAAMQQQNHATAVAQSMEDDLRKAISTKLELEEQLYNVTSTWEKTKLENQELRSELQKKSDLLAHACRTKHATGTLDTKQSIVGNDSMKSKSLLGKFSKLSSSVLKVSFHTESDAVRLRKMLEESMSECLNAETKVAECEQKITDLETFRSFVHDLVEHRESSESLQKALKEYFTQHESNRANSLK